MNVCIIGDGLTSLSLAKNLINKKINVHIYHEGKNNISPNRTIGISKSNFEFFKKEIYNIKDKWEIKKIGIYSEKLNDKIINCLPKNFIDKKYFLKKIEKKYNNHAYTAILKHNKLKNNTATQTFTKYGPIAFLPISETETSVVYSLDTNKNNYDKKKVVNLIKNYNSKYIIKKISKLDYFELRSSNLRQYYYKNIVAFGDCLHKIHPLAGQGFNMTIRDIKVISSIIQNRINLGMQLDLKILEEFERKTKHINFIFSSGIDSIFEIFNFDKKIKNQKLNKIMQLIGRNKVLKSKFIKYADSGINS